MAADRYKNRTSRRYDRKHRVTEMKAERYDDNAGHIVPPDADSNVSVLDRLN